MYPKALVVKCLPVRRHLITRTVMITDVLWHSVQRVYIIQASSVKWENIVGFFFYSSHCKNNDFIALSKLSKANLI